MICDWSLIQLRVGEIFGEKNGSEEPDPDRDDG